MLNSIVERSRLISPLNATEKKIIRSAAKLFLQNGFSSTTLKMISADCGLLQGTIAYHFHTKEDMLYLLIQELMDFHSKLVATTEDETGDKLLAFATEVTAQISICEADSKAWDLYHAAYSLPGTLELIKDWTSRKNYRTFHERLPGWTERDFRIKENIASGIEFSALTSPCHADHTLEDKISSVLDSLFLLYKIPKEERERVIGKILELDYRNLGQELLGQFANRLKQSAEDA
ncbi:MAG: TetR/AcrR family transcriptional regulator [Clostridia bacterium]|nr:TetR/AcrR family transcriptional regulator [Clostridia bacterium]